MEQILARCGNRCDLCPIYEANIKSDADRKTVSEKFQKYFGFSSPPEAMNCAGCLNEKGPQVNPGCKIRPCVIEKGLENCAHCDEFGCDKLKPAMDFITTYVKDLSVIPEEDYDAYINAFSCKDHLLKIREG